MFVVLVDKPVIKPEFVTVRSPPFTRRDPLRKKLVPVKEMPPAVVVIV